MSFRQELLLLLCYVFLADASQVRILVNCDRNGFTCNTLNSKRLVTYQCPSSTQDVIVHLWNFGEPSNTAWLVIKNCETVEIDMSCTSYRRSFESLTILNVTNLKFTRTTTTVKNPTKVVIKNVRNINSIPENTFSVPHMVKYNGETSQHELQEIEFDHVHVGTIEGHAFHSLRGFRNFTWRNVKVDRLHANAIKITFNMTEKYAGEFRMEKSAVEISEYLSFQMYVKKASFLNNEFVEIMPGGINGTVETFNFVDNVVNTLQSGSISILSKTVNIIGNTFNYLKSGSLEKISPGLLIDSHTSFGNLNFQYKFNNNNVIYVDAGSLNPDMVAYTKVATDFFFSYNTFLCTCENMGWLMSSIGHGYSTSSLQKFYETITNRENLNICSGLSCRKTIADIQQSLENGSCNPKFTMEYFCQTTTVAPTTDPSKYRSEEVMWLNRSDMVHSGSNNSITNVFLLLFTSFYFIYCQYVF
ncbi:uncharacterized protein LOC123322852 [Coccinella septempunctata]|uniref:uncharacterized protein LOC123322852 n=1 Tax=Coccinella septempunctata TaxID=41139 RepID=UPI001D089B68|nr:uncharacterized protein LOC123322852 [Coccinella septempunctata]